MCLVSESHSQADRGFPVPGAHLEDSGTFLSTLLSEEAMMNERALPGLTVYLDLLFLTQILHKEPALAVNLVSQY